VVSAQVVKELREKTGVGMMACKEALMQSGDDLDKAIDFLRQKGLASAIKKGDRTVKEGVIGSYIHMGGKIGTLVEINCETDFVARTSDFQELVKDIAMQIAGHTPPAQYVRREEVPPDLIEKELAIYMAQARETQKPEAVIAKIAEGKLEKFYQENCLMEQIFIKDPQVKIKGLLAQKVVKLGENIQVRRFVRYQMGESLSL